MVVPSHQNGKVTMYTSISDSFFKFECSDLPFYVCSKAINGNYSTLLYRYLSVSVIVAEIVIVFSIAFSASAEPARSR